MKKLVLLFLILSIGTGCGHKKIENKTEQEENQIAVKQVDIKENRASVKIKNTTNKLQYIDSIFLTFKGEQGEELETVRLPVYETLGAGISKELEVRVETPKKKIISYEYRVQA